ncbi:MAG: ABC transporter ATP-binding protein [Planctomycetes bacterium]|nr:ABC transporter ATP-binding protein [Planctomycetota bacterium]
MEIESFVSVLKTKDAAVVRDGVTIISGVNLIFDLGKLYFVAGPNGAGKSTLFRMLAGLWKQSAGEVHLRGESIISRSRRNIAKNISYVPQSYALDYEFTVEEIVAMGRYVYTDIFGRERIGAGTEIEDAMQKVDVLGLRERQTTTLSGGEKQRVLLARCLAGNAEIIMLDEPTANLDVAHCLGVFELLRSLLALGKCIIVSGHDLGMAYRYADEIVLMNRGRVVKSGPPSEMMDRELVREVFGVDSELLANDRGEKFLAFTRLPPS